MLYKFKVMQHGKDEFDKGYFGIFFNKYDLKELLFYYRWFKGWINLLDKFLPLQKGSGKKVLEIGCALGSFAKHLKERDFAVTAVDISDFIIEKAKKLQKDVKFKVVDIEKNTPSSEKYDFIFAFEVLEHLKSPKKALENIKKLLQKDAVLVFSTPLPTKQTLADPMHINVHNSQYWIALGKSLGYKETSFKQVAFIPFLYRFHSIFSVGFPTKFSIPFINNTCLYFFKL